MSLDLSDKTWPGRPSEHESFKRFPPGAWEKGRGLYQRQFVTEGMMVALPMGFPNLTTPLPSGEAAITALTVGPDEVIYGGTSGRRAHLFCAFLRGATGLVHDMTAVDEAVSCMAVGAASDGYVYACVNSENAGWIVRRKLQPIPFDCLQEWCMFRGPAERVIEPLHGKILHGVFGPGNDTLVAILDDGSLIRVELGEGKVRSLASAGPMGRYSERLVRDASGSVYGTGFDGQVWRLAPDGDKIEPWDVCLPCGAGRQFYNKPSAWAYDKDRNVFYGASEADGTLFSLDLASRQVRSLGLAGAFTRIAAMSVTSDGRVFGITGGEDDVGRLFCYDPDRRELRDLGVCVSTLGARAYGLVFGAATTWSGGAVIFGEADRVSHLWVYFPALRCPQTAHACT